MIQFKCSCCGQLLQLADEWAGKVAKCPYSGQFMQVPGLMPAPMPGPAPAAAPAQGGGYYNPFADPGYTAPAPPTPRAPAGPPPAEFGHFSGAVAADAQQRTFSKGQRDVWRVRGTQLGALGGAILGLMFGVVFGVVAKSAGGTSSMMLGTVTVIFGGAVLGAGAGGIIGPTLFMALQGFKGISSQGAVRGAMFGTARVAGFGAVGGLLAGPIHGAFVLLGPKAEPSAAVMISVLTALLMGMGWAAAGALLGGFFGAALGSLGGYE
jgi:hypothetical protein